MFRRLSVVESIYVNSVSFSSVLQIGDSSHITPVTQALAVKREYPLFFSNEGNFNEYSVFTRPIPAVSIEESFNMATFNEKPNIKVNTIRVTGASASSVIHIGSTNNIRAEARIKHIRQLLDQPEDMSISKQDQINSQLEGPSSSEEGGA
ncbi:spore germination protein GerPE [Litchfieldia salsa]|uniref:Spore germination protein PE n=1 Tax=Litchfieldia salsa TaxID=930152 RepID=A0A1H0UMM9_9BACI|nr:spore germination protein GerPE [Litchfieldia salsa]SDP67449.1 spore germination protein PE [Litchfieldia salsa]